MTSRQVHVEREERKTGRQTDRQETDRQADKVDRQTDKLREMQADKQKTN